MAFDKIQESVRFIFRKKSEEIIEINLKALQAGREITDRNRMN